MSELIEQELKREHELIAQAMLATRGDLVKASRFDSIEHNAMSLRREVSDNPQIRARYHVLLSQELQESGLHIAERILKMVKLQDHAFGDPDNNIPPDPKTAIELSKEISRLIAEGKGQNVSAKSAVVIASKEDAAEILSAFLDS